MRNLRHLSSIALLLAACDVGEPTIDDGQQIEPAPGLDLEIAATPAPAAEPVNFEIPMDPTQDGTFCVCDSTEPVNVMTAQEAHFYWPGGVGSGTCGGPCNTVEGVDHPLVILTHAVMGQIGNGLDSYGELGARLASHGMVVAVIDPDGDVVARMQDTMATAEAEFTTALSDETALIGHSKGGEMVVLHSGVVDASGRTLSGLVLMAPRVDDEAIYPLDDGIGAFLGLHWTDDNDGATYGNPNLDEWGSVFQLYDVVGELPGDPQTQTVTKDMVFFEHHSGTGEHYRQGNAGVVAYTAAFLRRELYGDANMDAYFTDQAPMALAQGEQPIGIQHQEPGRLVLANFETGQGMQPWPFVGVQTETIVAGPFTSTWDDVWSPHDEMVLPLSIPAVAAPRTLTIDLSPHTNVDDYEYLSFRVAQVYHDQTNPTGGDLDFTIRVRPVGERLRSVLASDYGALRFPVPQSVTLSGGGGGVTNVTKNAMRTYMIPIADFDGLAGTISSITLDFSTAPVAAYELVVDDFELVP